MEASRHEPHKESPEESHKAGYLERIVELIPDGVISVDTESRIVYANKAAERFLGLKRERLLGRDSGDLGLRFATADGTVIPAEELPVSHVLRTKKDVRDFELQMTKDGRRLIFSVNAAPLWDADGGFIGAVISFTDITARKLAEEQLCITQEQLEQRVERKTAELTRATELVEKERERAEDILESITEGCFALDREWRFTYINKRGERLVQRSREQLLGKSIWDVYPEAIGTTFDVEYRKAMDERAPVFFEAVYPPFDVWYEVHAYPYRDGVTVYFHDISDRKRAEELREALSTINAAISSTLNLDAVLERAVVEAAKALYAEISYVRMLEDGEWVTMHQYGIRTEEPGMRLTAEEAISSELVRRIKKPLAISDAQADERINTAIMKSEGIRSIMIVPLIARQAVIGVLNFAYRSQKVTFTDDEVDFAGKLGTSVALAIENATLFAEERQKTEISDALNQVNAAINSTLDFDEIMLRVVVDSIKVIGAETASIALIEDGGWIVRYSYGLPAELIERRFSDSDIPHAALAANTGKQVVIDDAFADDRVNKEVMEAFGIRSVLVVPLMVREEAIGALFFNYHSAAVAFATDQIDFAGKLGASVSLALENARLYATEHQIADTLQESLVVAVPSIEGLEIGVAYESSAEAARVGGDFYDVFEIGHGKVAVVIGDVSGKGVEAAVATATARSTIRAIAYSTPSPGYMLERANESIMRQVKMGSFITAAIIVLDIAGGAFSCASAGHPPPMVCCPSCLYMDIVPGYPIGTFKGDYEEYRGVLKKDEMIVVYTDGLVEARRKGELFGYERALESLPYCTGLTCQDATDNLLKAARRFAGGKLVDDVALVSIRRLL